MSLIQKFKFEECTFEVYSKMPEFQLFHVHQTHSNIVLPALGLNQGMEADGILSPLTLKPFTPIAIKTADCLPLAMWNKDEVALIHLGWKGLAHHLLSENKDQFSQYTNAFIGPCIHACCFEVSEDFNLSFPDSQAFFNKSESKMTFDLIAECKKQIHQIFPKIVVQDSGLCTFCHLEFHSYRRNKTNQRMWNIIRKD